MHKLLIFQALAKKKHKKAKLLIMITMVKSKIEVVKKTYSPIIGRPGHKGKKS